MSWLDKVEGIEMSIITGDGKVFVVSYFTSSVSKNITYNVAEFLFINKTGSLVKRSKPRGAQYDFEFLFDGPDNLDDAKTFLKSAANSDPWTINHPMYDALYVQPTSLTVDNSVLNVTTIRGVVIETLKDNGSKKTFISAKERVTSDTVANMALAANSYADILPVIPTMQKSSMLDDIHGMYNAITDRLNSVEDNISSIRNTYNAGVAVINSGVYNSLQVISQVQRIIVAPAYFLDSILSRLQMFEACADILNQNAESILHAYNVKTAKAKKQYETLAATNVAALCLSMVTNITDDYRYRPTVLSYIVRLLSVHNTFLGYLDRLQSSNGGVVDGYIPDPNVITPITTLVNNTVTSLFNVANSAQQERVITYNDDTNIILVADELYGMQEDDSTIQFLMDTNNIQLSELFVLPAGRTIKFYV
jgi:hypothetical protein